MKQLDLSQTTLSRCLKKICQIDGKEKMVAEIEAMLQSILAANRLCQVVSGWQK